MCFSTYPSKEEIAAYCAVIEPVEAIQIIKQTWLKRGDIQALGFIVDDMLFNEWLSNYRRECAVKAEIYRLSRKSP